jgi:phage regulator Rha-like protein
MKELIKIHQQGPDLRADSRDIAKLFGITHQHFRETIEDNESHLSQLGVIRFETGKPESKEGGRPEKFCYLNFDQIALLLTLTRSTEQTKEFRLKLIIAFRDAR